MKERLLSILLALCMALTLLPGTALAAGSDFTIQNGVLTRYNGTGTAEAVIPSGVTAIGARAFNAHLEITKVSPW